MPTPSSRMVSDCSKISQPMPRARSISAVVRPPMPPPTIIAFIAQTPLDTQAMDSGSHGPLLGRKRLCGLRHALRPGLGLSLNPELLHVLAIAHAVAEYLLLAGQILRRAEHPVSPIPGRGLHGEEGIDQMRPAECDEIGPPSRQNGIGLVGGSDVADAHGRNARLVADLVGERGLEHTSIDRLGVAHRLAGGDVHEVDAGLGESAGDLARIVAGDTAR